MREIKSYATDEQRQQIWDRFREDNKRISIEFLGKDEDLFPAPVKRGAVSVGETDYWKEAVLILSGACLAVNRKNLELESRLNKLEASVQSLQTELLNYNHAIHIRESLFRETEQSLHDITNSRSWKLTVPLRRINKFLKRL